MGDGEIIGWGVDIGVGYGFDIVDGFKFVLDDESIMDYSGGSLGGLDNGKHVGSLIYE